MPCNSRYFKVFRFVKWALLQVSRRCLSQDSLAFAALRHEAPRILRWVLLPSAAKKKGLHFSHLHLTLTCHVIFSYFQVFSYTVIHHTFNFVGSTTSLIILHWLKRICLIAHVKYHFAYVRFHK